MTSVRFNESGQPDLGDKSEAILARLKNLEDLAYMSVRDKFRREAFYRVSALNLLATNYPPLPHGETKPREGAAAIKYWGDYIFSRIGKKVT